jgi:hypothetical protein
MKCKNKIATLLTLTLLGSCSTIYEKEGIFNNGYSDSRVAQDVFLVTFRANERTNPEKVRKYALRRAAEVCLEHGFSYFAVLEQIDSSTKKNLYYPSLRFKIQCYHSKPLDRDVIDARQMG